MAAVSRRTIAQAVVDRIRTRADREAIARELADYLVQERRTRELDLIMREVAALRLAQDGVLEVTASSVYPLTDAIKQRVTQLFDADQVIVREVIDPDLVGGIKVEANDQVIDASIRRQLNALRNATNAVAPKGGR